MARVSLKEDAKLTKRDLLRPSVVAWLLGVAPKTIHAWKDVPVKKIHGVKYLRWHDICAKCSDALEILDLPSDASDAYYKWVTQKSNISIAKPIVNVAANAIEKAKTLLKSQIQPKVEKIETAKQLESQTDLQTDDALGIADDYKHLLKDKVPVVTDGCPSCKHSKSKFHNKYRCNFAIGTVVECKCKKGT